MSEDSKLFPVTLVWTGGNNGAIFIEGKAVVKTGGPSGKSVRGFFHTPEEMFVASATVCYMNGFVNFAEKMHIGFKTFSCDAVGILEKVDRSFEITEIAMRARIEIDSDDLRNRIERALELAAKYCFVGNSMKCPISHHTEIIVK
jgi:organic hydroperoxide reductase OsmC/OhrA